MRRALEIAARGLWTTTPNPAVGCVLAKGEQAIAEGWHERAGEAHAEAAALAKAGADARGSTAYVTLEPCSTYGRTPPCADALIAAGVARVVYAMSDPNPAVDGAGAQRLRAAGVEVQGGLLKPAAAALNEGYISRQTRGRPFVTVKWAQSLDGATAMQSGESQWITGAAARRAGHELRARACAVLTGSGTVLADDPRLTARDVGAIRQPLRVVLDSRARVPTSARVMDDAAPTLVIATGSCDHGALAGAQVQRWQVPAAESGGADLGAVLEGLAADGINELLVEAGATLTGAVLAAGLADRVVAFVAPSVLGSETRPVLRTPGWTRLADGQRLAIESVQLVGEDLRVALRPAMETD